MKTALHVVATSLHWIGVFGSKKSRLVPTGFSKVPYPGTMIETLDPNASDHRVCREHFLCSQLDGTWGSPLTFDLSRYVDSCLVLQRMSFIYFKSKGGGIRIQLEEILGINSSLTVDLNSGT